MAGEEIRWTADPGARHVGLWVLAVVFFGFGDLGTTVIGVGLAGVTEAGVVTAVLLERYGIAALVVVKAVVLVGYYVVWRLVPAPHSVGVPLGLALLGVTVTGWNLHVVLTALATP